MRLPVPLESEEQKVVFDWAEHQMGKYPELKWMHHIPNGGSRNKIEAVNLKKQGVKPGVSDICLPCPRGGYHGLYIEMKRIKGCRTTEDQEKFMEFVRNNGYFVHECKGAKEAIEKIKEYLEMEG